MPRCERLRQDPQRPGQNACSDNKGNAFNPNVPSQISENLSSMRTCLNFDASPIQVSCLRLLLWSGSDRGLFVEVKRAHLRSLQFLLSPCLINPSSESSVFRKIKNPSHLWKKRIKTELDFSRTTMVALLPNSPWCGYYC